MSLDGAIARWWLQQNWVSLRYKKSAHRRLRELGEVHDMPFTKNFFGLCYEGNLRNGIEFAIYYYGAFEKPLLFFLSDLATRLKADTTQPLCFWDIGSNVGQHALYMSQHAAEVHAFEPFPVVRERLEHHIQLNQLDNITVHPVGLGQANEALDFYAPTGSNMGVGSFVRDACGDKEPPKRDFGKLSVVTGDSCVADRGITPPGLLKIDVEGFERAVLSGMAHVLGKHRPPVVCEITYGSESSFTSLEDLQQAFPEDYVLYYFETRKPDGSKDRRRTSRAKRSGAYKLAPLQQWRALEQDDIVAIPSELESRMPLQNP